LSPSGNTKQQGHLIIDLFLLIWANAVSVAQKQTRNATGSYCPFQNSIFIDKDHPKPTIVTSQCSNLMSISPWSLYRKPRKLNSIARLYHCMCLTWHAPFLFL
jgi:hypothetical protein